MIRPFFTVPSVCPHSHSDFWFFPSILYPMPYNQLQGVPAASCEQIAANVNNDVTYAGPDVLCMVSTRETCDNHGRYLHPHLLLLDMHTLRMTRDSSTHSSTGCTFNSQWFFCTPPPPSSSLHSFVHIYFPSVITIANTTTVLNRMLNALFSWGHCSV